MKSSKKINKILFAETKSPYYYPYQTFYNPLKRACKKLISFDTRWNFFMYGKEKMNDMFLEVIEKEKPDCIFMWINCDEYDLDKLLKIRKISPKTQLLLYFGDDDFQFDNFSRYFMLFLDYGLIAQKKYVPEYYKDGIKNIFFVIGLDKEFFKPISRKKKYDVTFIGAAKEKESGRYELIKFLKDNGVKINLFGWNWEKYPEFKEIYHGPLEADKMVEVLNQSKINLCFSKAGDGKTQLKGKVFEANACKTFILTEYCEDYLEMFKENKEIVFFKNKEELLQKINYYLEHEKEREKIAEAAYKKTIQKYSLDADLEKIFRKISTKKELHKPLPKLNNKIAAITKKEINLSKQEIENKLKNVDYVILSDGKSEHLKYREYLQVYSLQKTGKQISCCNYYVYSKLLGDYLHFYAGTALRMINQQEFNFLLNVNQLMTTKKFLLENMEHFKKLFDGKKINLVTKENTAFVGLPLVRIKKFNYNNYKVISQVFEFKFLWKLFSLKQHKNPGIIFYLFALLFEILRGKTFIFKIIYNRLKNSKIKEKVKRLRSN